MPEKTSLSYNGLNRNGNKNNLNNRGLIEYIKRLIVSLL